ncbi:hypothetical protein NP493_502g00035 [Ridgeia piscesae]|uniref:Uncharacterized protein n=1 Tax=Ridgeia piscesae TaxID=27915 RepID=A0AAD9KX10_RIDPI|nr:hypothetical protein NP493_502g00035 [Ridgeia piscesae]
MDTGDDWWGRKDCCDTTRVGQWTNAQVRLSTSVVTDHWSVLLCAHLTLVVKLLRFICVILNCEPGITDDSRHCFDETVLSECLLDILLDCGGLVVSIIHVSCSLYSSTGMPHR